MLAVAEGQGGEEFARGTGADGRVVLERDDFLQEFHIVRGKPGKAQAGEAVGFTDRAEADGAVVQVASSGQAIGGIVFEFTIDFVRKNVNVVARGELQNFAKNFRTHEQAGGIVRRVDVEGTRVRADKRFESGKIVGPAVFGFAAP